MRGAVSRALVDDVSAMVELSERYRWVKAQHEPVLWSRAEDSRERQLPYLEYLVRDEAVLSLVHVIDGVLDGFVIGTLAPCAPVYSAGLACMVDDFCVAKGGDWQSVGRQLLIHLRHLAENRGARQVVVVCARFDEEERAMLATAGLTVASEWYAGTL